MKKPTLFKFNSTLILIWICDFTILLSQERMVKSVLGCGATIASSGSVKLTATLGQSIINLTSNTNIQNSQGFWFGTNVITISIDSDLAQVEYLIYPNPVADYLRIKTSEVSDNPLKLVVSDSKGSICSNWNISQNDLLNEQSFDISYLDEGVYFLTIIRKNSTFNKKFIKVKN